MGRSSWFSSTEVVSIFQLIVFILQWNNTKYLYLSSSPSLRPVSDLVIAVPRLRALSDSWRNSAFRQSIQRLTHFCRNIKSKKNKPEEEKDTGQRGGGIKLAWGERSGQMMMRRKDEMDAKATTDMFLLFHPSSGRRNNMNSVYSQLQRTNYHGVNLITQ